MTGDPVRVAYPGLRAFTREEFDIFFGRESCVDQMVDTLAATHFLAVLGTSGSGKSSLVRTGLLNALELGLHAAAGSNWLIADFRPRGQPIRSLAEALLKLRGVNQPTEDEVRIQASFLRHGRRSLIQWCENGNLPKGWNLIILADQFEELFRYEDYSGREEAEAFVGLLLEAARDKSLPIHVVITMRSEYLGDCTLIEGLPEAIDHGLYLTPRMTRDECRQAIVGPAAVFDFAIEDALVNKLLNDLTDFAPWDDETDYDQRRRLRRRADQLPLMQHVLNLLWQRAKDRNDADIILKLADYEAAGGLGGALDRHADEVAGRIDPRHADVIDIVFRGLVTGKSVADAVRRPTRFGELVELAGGRRESVAAVVDAFRAHGVNFLIPDANEPLADETIIDISHESLIRQWRRLSRCLTEEARSADAWQQLLSRAERYAAKTGGLLTGLDLDNLVAWWRATEPSQAWSNRYGNRFAEAKQFLDQSEAAETERKRRDDEAQRKLITAEEEARTGRRFRWLAYGLAAAVVLAVLGAGAALYQQNQATEQAELADEARAEAVRQAELARLAQIEAEKQAELADEARAIAEAERRRAEDAFLKALLERSKADDARREAEAAQAAANAARAEADRLRGEAVAARDEARAAAERERQLVDGGLARLNTSLNRYVDDLYRSIDNQPELVPDAGSLLARLARDASVTAASLPPNVSDIIERLRAAFVLQAGLSGKTIPIPTNPENQKRWIQTSGDPSYALAFLAPQPTSPSDTEFKPRFLQVADRIGRLIARLGMPEELGADLDARHGVAPLGGDTVAVLLVGKDGKLWAASGTGEDFTAVGNAPTVRSLDDVRYDPADGRLYAAYFTDAPAAARVAVIERQGSGWSAVGDFPIPARSDEPAPRGGTIPLSSVAGVASDAIYLVADYGLTILDAKSGARRPTPSLGTVVSARLTDDDRFLLVGTDVGQNGACPEQAPTTSGALEPTFGAGDGFQKTGAVVGVVPAQSAPAETPPPPPVLNCLILLDASKPGLPRLWAGKVTADTHVRSARSLSAAGTHVEIAQGTVPNYMRVLRLEANEASPIIETRGTFDPLSWGYEGYSDDYSTVAASGRGYAGVISRERMRELLDLRALRKIIGVGNRDNLLAWRVGERDLQAAAWSSGSDANEQVLDFWVFRPGARELAVDGGFPAKIPCPKPETGTAACKFKTAAFSPDGRILLVGTADDRHAFIDRRGVESWLPNRPPAATSSLGTMEPMMKREVTFTKLVPLDNAGDAFLAQDAEARLWRVTRGGERAEGATSDLEPFRLPADLRLPIAGFASDPGSETVYAWGRRIGVAAIPANVPEAGAPEIIASWTPHKTKAIAAAPLANDRLAVVTADGRLSVLRRDGKNLVVETTLTTGLTDIDSLYAANDRIIVNAGHNTAIYSSLRAAGYALVDGRLKLAFMVPWDQLAAQLPSGEAASIAFGLELFDPPPQIPSDEDLHALAMMREDEGAPVVEKYDASFYLLRARTHPDDLDVAAPFACETATTIAVHAFDDAPVESISDQLESVCEIGSPGFAIADALRVEGSERILTLLPLAEKNRLALAILYASLRTNAPHAAAALAAYEPWLGQMAPVEDLKAVADGGPVSGDVLSKALAGNAAGLDPYGHWLLAVTTERQATTPEKLGVALRHYALAERLFRAAGTSIPPAVVARRLALARILSGPIVIDAFHAVEDELGRAAVKPPPSDPSGPTAPASLEHVAEWLAKVEASSADGDGVKPLLALVEEALGNRAAASDRAQALGHYRRAVELLAASTESLSEVPGVAGLVGEVSRLREELYALGNDAGVREAANAVLRIVDRDLNEPVTNNANLRNEIRVAFNLLTMSEAAPAAAAWIDDLRFAFLDYDWESRYQTINNGSAQEFLEELQAAEHFLTALVEASAGEAQKRWLGLRGRLRFWLSTMNTENLPNLEKQAFARWLADGLADYEAAGGAEAVALWDRVTIGDGYSNQLKDTLRGGDWRRPADRALAAFARAAGDPEFGKLSFYRQRLVYDGYLLALGRAITYARDYDLFAGLGPQPGEADYDRKRLAEIAYDTLSLRQRREELRKEAVVLNLPGTYYSTWSLDREDNFQWGYTVAELAAMLRIESGANGVPTTCDRLAAHQEDLFRPSPPINFDGLNTDRILSECTGDLPRNQYYRGRALSKIQPRNSPEVVEAFVAAARGGLPIAYHNLAVDLDDLPNKSIADEREKFAQELWTAYSELSLIEGYAAIAGLLREEATTDQRRSTFLWLAGKAADLGVPEAHRDLADLMKGDDLGVALHLKIAENLFTEAGRTAEAILMADRLKTMNLPPEDLDTIVAEARDWQPDAPAVMDLLLEQRLRDLIAQGENKQTP